ncbi:hypothetical protein [Rhizobium sp.]
MIYFAAAYVIGLGVLVLGYLESPAAEKSNAKFAPAMAAYIFWPVSLIMIVFAAFFPAVWTRLSSRRAFAGVKYH